MSSSSSSGAVMSPFPFRKMPLEADRTGQLHGVSLERRAICELLEVFKTHASLVLREGRVDREPKSVDGVPLLGSAWRNRGTSLGSRLPLLISNQTNLESNILWRRKRPEEGVVKIECVSRVDAG